MRRCLLFGILSVLQLSACSHTWKKTSGLAYVCATNFSVDCKKSKKYSKKNHNKAISILNRTAKTLGSIRRKICWVLYNQLKIAYTFSEPSDNLKNEHNLTLSKMKNFKNFFSNFFFFFHNYFYWIWSINQLVD